MKNKMVMKGKKGQEEIMGFLLVVILVIVIGLTMIMLFKPASQEEVTDFQIENLLYTISATSYEGQSISSRIEDCSYDEGCNELGAGLDKIFDAAFTGSGIAIGQNLRGYSFNMSGDVEYYVEEGNKTGVSRGAAVVSGETLLRLKFYY